jgi:hypothetical protein
MVTQLTKFQPGRVPSEAQSRDNSITREAIRPIETAWCSDRLVNPRSRRKSDTKSRARFVFPQK